jgi:hypothetical protein
MINLPIFFLQHLPVERKFRGNHGLTQKQKYEADDGERSLRCSFYPQETNSCQVVLELLYQFNCGNITGKLWRLGLLFQGRGTLKMVTGSERVITGLAIAPLKRCRKAIALTSQIRKIAIRNLKPLFVRLRSV